MRQVLMITVEKKFLLYIFAVLIVSLCKGVLAGAGPYSIYEIQWTTDPNGNSPLEGQVIDCTGGIVTHKYGGSKPKLTIQDPNFPSGWGAIQVKDGLAGAPLFNKVAVGDRVTLSNMYVEEFRGNTTLQCLADNDPNIAVVSGGNRLPEAIVVRLDEIASPVQDLYGDWYVINHNAEKYEHTWIRVRNVTVTAMDLGKAKDNYVLWDTDKPGDPNFSCWASDYMNEDRSDNYHPYVYVGQHFCGVEGILEQYTKVSDGWDYYQLLTTRSEDFVVQQAADLEGDCDVDFVDFSIFAQHWLEEECNEPDWCSGADLTRDNPNGTVDIFDLSKFAQHWLEGK